MVVGIDSIRPTQIMVHEARKRLNIVPKRIGQGKAFSVRFYYVLQCESPRNTGLHGVNGLKTPPFPNLVSCSCPLVGSERLGSFPQICFGNSE